MVTRRKRAVAAAAATPVEKVKPMSAVIEMAFVPYVYDAPQTKYLAKLDEICRHQSLISKTDVSAVLYAGKYWLSSLHGYNTYTDRLDKTLHPYMDEIIELQKELEAEKAELRQFCGYLWMEAKAIANILPLTPSCLQPALSPALRIGVGEPVVTEEQVQNFHKIHEETINKIAYRLVWNMTS